VAVSERRGGTFLDTSVLLAGLIDVGPQSAPAQQVMHALAEQRLTAPCTAWHCCLEFYSVATRLPPEFRVSPADAMRLLQEEVLARLAVHDLPDAERPAFLAMCRTRSPAAACTTRTSPRWRARREPRGS